MVQFGVRPRRGFREDEVLHNPELQEHRYFSIASSAG
jgi:hypothetical protein